jgi:gliding motility-associated-like protein
MRLLLYTLLLFFIGFTELLSAPPDKDERVQIMNVTINDSSQYVTINWKSFSDTSYILDYAIHERKIVFGANSDSFLTFVSKTRTSYTFFYRKTKDKPVDFVMAARWDISKIGGTEPRTNFEDTAHRTIHNTIHYDSCHSNLTISWTKYVGWGSELKNYQIYDSITRDTIYTIEDTSKTSYTVNNIKPNQKRCYYIIANHKNGTLSSHSNTAIDTAYTLQPPAFITAESASYNPENTAVNLEFTLDPSSEIKNYALSRSASQKGSFTQIVPYSNSTGSTLHANDPNPLPTTGYYRLEAMNGCSLIDTFSNLATAIVPSYTVSALTVNLSWNAYQEWGQVPTYDIFRNIGNSEFQNIKTVNETSTTDNLSSVAGQQFQGIISYYILARSGNNTSQSKTVTIDLESEIFIPNAFTPDGNGQNDVFQVFFAFIPTDFKMIVYDRYGFKVFETSDYTSGWNGVLSNGKKAPEGAYIYLIYYTTGKDRKIEKKGNFSLIYPKNK